MLKNSIFFSYFNKAKICIVLLKLGYHFGKKSEHYICLYLFIPNNYIIYQKHLNFKRWSQIQYK